MQAGRDLSSASMPDIVRVMTRRVYIHAGAHRTGTSSFQMCLSQNRAVLADAGFDVAYPGRDGIPQGRLKLQLPRPRHGEKRVPQYAGKLRSHLQGFSTGPARALIVSEENIPGPMRHFYEGRFFPASAKRFAALAGALDGPPEHVLYVVRAYDALYVSAYRKRAEDNAVEPFADIVPNFLAMDRGWPELVAEMRDILKPKRLSVVEYSARGDSRSLLARLVPELSPDALSEPQEKVNLSATDAALVHLQERYQAGEELTRDQWKEVLAHHAGDHTPRGVAQFDPAAQTKLSARYGDDMARLAGMDGVGFVGPNGAG